MLCMNNQKDNLFFKTVFETEVKRGLCQVVRITHLIKRDIFSQNTNTVDSIDLLYSSEKCRCENLTIAL